MREWQAIRQQPQHCTTPFVTYARCPVYSKFQQNFKIWKQWDIFRAGYVTVERLSKEAQRTAIVATKNLLWASFDYYSTLLTGVQTCYMQEIARNMLVLIRHALPTHIFAIPTTEVVSNKPILVRLRACYDVHRQRCRHSEATPILVRPKHVVTHTGRAGVHSEAMPCWSYAQGSIPSRAKHVDASLVHTAKNADMLAGTLSPRLSNTPSTGPITIRPSMAAPAGEAQTKMETCATPGGGVTTRPSMSALVGEALNIERNMRHINGSSSDAKEVLNCFWGEEGVTTRPSMSAPVVEALNIEWNMRHINAALSDAKEACNCFLVGGSDYAALHGCTGR
eukprot:1160256-Pelagomonas_calceolata.AAC.10